MPPRALARSVAATLFALALGVAACGGRDADDAVTEAGDVDLTLMPSEAEALKAIEHPVEFELGEARLEQLLTARERLGQVEASAATEALALDVRKADLDGSDGPVGEIVERLQEDPEARRAIEGSGLSVRDYVSATFAMQQAVLARGVDARGALPPVLLANMQVVERNGDRVAQLTEGTPFAAVVAANFGRIPATATDFSGLTAAAVAPGPAAARTGSDASAPAATSSDASRAALRDYDPRPRGKAKGRKKGKGRKDD